MFEGEDQFARAAGIMEAAADRGKSRRFCPAGSAERIGKRVSQWQPAARAIGAVIGASLPNMTRKDRSSQQNGGTECIGAAKSYRQV